MALCNVAGTLYFMAPEVGANLVQYFHPFKLLYLLFRWQFRSTTPKRLSSINKSMIKYFYIILFQDMWSIGCTLFFSVSGNVRHINTNPKFFVSFLNCRSLLKKQLSVAFSFTVLARIMMLMRLPNFPQTQIRSSAVWSLLSWKLILQGALHLVNCTIRSSCINSPTAAPSTPK